MNPIRLPLGKQKTVSCDVDQRKRRIGRTFPLSLGCESWLDNFVPGESPYRPFHSPEEIASGDKTTRTLGPR
jgi:hypothetical protein